MRAKYPGLSFSATCLPSFSVTFQPIYDIQAQRQIGVQAEALGAAGECSAKIARTVPPLLLPALYQKMMLDAIQQSETAATVVRGSCLLIRLPVILAPEQVSLAFPARAAVAAGIDPANVLLEIEAASLVTREAVALFRHEEIASAAREALHGLPCLTALSPGFRPVLKMQGRGWDDCAAKPSDRRALSRFAQLCQFHGVTLIAESVESEATCLQLLEAGVRAMHGPLFANGIPTAFKSPVASRAAASAA